MNDEDLPHPHPYSGRKYLFFNGLQAAFRRKIFKTNELFAEYSRIRSYETFRCLPAAFWLTSEAGTIEGKASEDYCATKGRNNLQTDELLAKLFWGYKEASGHDFRGCGKPHKNLCLRGRDVATLLRRAGHELHALKLCNDGTPSHPLYLKGTLRPSLFGEAANILTTEALRVE
jgi:hypothetical protein